MLLSYASAGWQLVRIKPGQKLPVDNHWQTLSPQPENFGADHNIGVQLGPKSGGLVDIDLDIPQARALAGLPCFFGNLPSFGRSTLPMDQLGHRICICEDAPDKKFAFAFTTKEAKEATASLKLEKGVVLEVRAGGGHQTVFPPSRYPGCELVWQPGFAGPIPAMDWEGLRTRAGVLAFCSFAAACYPAEGGRDDFCLSFAGALLYIGVPEDDAEDIIEAVARLNGDEEARQRRAKVRGTARKKAEGEPVNGLPGFLKHIGMEACEKTVRKWLGMEGGPQQRAPAPADAIMLGIPEKHIVDEQIQALFRESDLPIYRQGRRLVITGEEEEVVRSNGETKRYKQTVLMPVSATWLCNQASRIGEFYRMQEKGPKRVAPDLGCVSSLLDPPSVMAAGFRAVQGLSMVPTLTRSVPGYDPETQLILAFPPGEFPGVPEAPTQEEALAAMARLKRPLRGFDEKDRWASPADRSVAIAHLITAVIRRELRTAPFFCYDASKAGSGKTMLAQAAAILAVGHEASPIVITKDESETKKTVDAKLLAGHPYLLIDNLDVVFKGATFDAMATSEKMEVRTLGASLVPEVSTRVTLAVTGNNFTFGGDLARRVMMCRLEPKEANPEEVEFGFDFLQEVRDLRAELVVAVLTMVKAYLAAGRPSQNLSKLGSFPDWDLVRETMVWLGEVDPVLTKAGLKEQDPAVQERGALFELLLRTYGVGCRFKLGDIAAMPDLDDNLKRRIGDMLPGSKWRMEDVSSLFRRHKGNSVMGLKLHAKPYGRAKVNAWWLEGNPEPELAAEVVVPKEEDLPF